MSTPWWSFNPHQAEYVNLGSPASLANDTVRTRDFYAYLGTTLKYRIVNALLQGQFRHSDLEFDRTALRPLVAEAWGGITYEFKSRLRITAFIRTRTAELVIKSHARRPTWGGFVISKSY